MINKNFNDPILYKLNAVKTFCIKILKVNVVFCAPLLNYKAKG